MDATMGTEPSLNPLDESGTLGTVKARGEPGGSGGPNQT